MDKNHKKHLVSGSIESTSIVRKFTILFLIMSIIPMLVLVYFYYQIMTVGQVQMTESEFNITLIFVVLGVFTGYIAMRSMLVKLVRVTVGSTKALEGVLSSEKVEELNQEKNEIDVLSQAFKVVTTRLEENIKSLEMTKKTLHAVMSKVGQGLSNAENIDAFLELIVETITDALYAKVGVLMLYDKEEGALTVKTVNGAEYDVTNPIKLRTVSGTTMHQVIKSKKPVVITEFGSDMKEVSNEGLFMMPVVCAPLITNDVIHGVVAVSGGMIDEDFSDDELILLLNLASQTAVAIENSRLSKNIESTYFETISALALAVDAKDKYSRGHLDRVAHYCLQIANELGLSEEDKKMLRDAARLHDLGKIGIPDSLLRKEGPLDDDEWILMKKHPEMGESIIKPIKSLSHFCDIIRHHHEKLDGSGYPDGLKGDEITPLVRITTVADIYDALTTDRSYRQKMTKEKAAEILMEMKDQLDQDIVAAFVKTLHIS